MKLPLCQKKTTNFPKNHKCPVCGTKFKGDFVVLGAGALFGTEDSASMDDRMLGFADIVSHFDSDDYHHRTTIASEVHMGQFEITVCSHVCLKTLLNDIIDKSEDHYMKNLSKKMKMKYGN